MLQRLFRNPEASKLIKRCNDFGAGGVSVAIGELADGLEINLNAVPKKYDGLDGTELAISESQERMAVVVAKEDVERFCQLAESENLEATVVAEVKENPYLKIFWNGIFPGSSSTPTVRRNTSTSKSRSTAILPRKQQRTLPMNTWRLQAISTSAQRGDFPKDLTPPSAQARY